MVLYTRKQETKVFKFNCEYLVNFDTTKNVFNYSVHLGKNASDLYEIKYEKLMEKSGNYPNNNYKTVFECSDGELVSIELGKKHKEPVIKKTLNLLSTHSMIYLYLTKGSSQLKN